MQDKVVVATARRGLVFFDDGTYTGPKFKGECSQYMVDGDILYFRHGHMMGWSPFDDQKCQIDVIFQILMNKELAS